MRVLLAQVNPTVGHLSGNADLVREGIRAGRRAGAALVLFPELVISGYPPEDLLFRDHFVRDCEELVGELAEEVEGTLAVVGCPLLEEGRLYNGALVLGEGNVIARYRKIRLPNYAVFDERRYFSPGERVVVLSTPEGRVGLNICEDIWNLEGPSEEAALRGGADVIANISMSPYDFGKGGDRTAMLARRARDAGAYILYANGVGGQDELIFDGASLAVGPDGRVMASGRQFEQDLILVDLDTAVAADAAGAGRAPGEWPVEDVPVPEEAWLAGDSATMAGDSATVAGDPPAAAGDVGTEARLPRVRASSSPLDPLEPMEELYRALTLGVRDYVRKNGFHHVVFGLSGGVDSSLAACIAVDALGAPYVTGVSMPSRYTSTGTRSDARVIAENLGIEFLELPIEDIFAAYLDALSGPFADVPPNVAEENIQARIRGNLLMALSNKFGWLVLTTGNKSEMAVGYATLYGDMAGGFAVIKDVPKMEVYRLTRYRNDREQGPGPVPDSVLERPPSAELAFDQQDQDSLPPYEVLDRVIDEYVVHDRSIEEIVAGGVPLEIVDRVVTLIDRNEYKRRQAAPGPRITSKAFGKDRRLPITNRYRG